MVKKKLPLCCNQTTHQITKDLRGVQYQLTYWVGDLIYLAYTHPEIIYVVAKFSKCTECPGIVHEEALVHLLHCLHDNTLLSLCFYPNFLNSTLYGLLSNCGVYGSNLLVTFTDFFLE